jgi:hypothetical protein
MNKNTQSKLWKNHLDRNASIVKWNINNPYKPSKMPSGKRQRIGAPGAFGKVKPYVRGVLKNTQSIFVTRDE